MKNIAIPFFFGKFFFIQLPYVKSLNVSYIIDPWMLDCVLLTPSGSHRIIHKHYVAVSKVAHSYMDFVLTFDGKACWVGGACSV